MKYKKGNLREVAKVFFKLGCIGFGGPAVHIAMMQDEVVTKRKWFSHEHFLDLIGATNLIPGPNSTEMTMHCGHERAGWRGLVIAGICFIFPAVIITSVFAWAYKQYGSLPEVAPFLSGIKPAILAVIVSAMVTLGQKTFKTIQLSIIGIACVVASLAGVNEIVVLFGAGGLGILYHILKTSRNKNFHSLFPLLVLQPSNLKLYLIFLKVGAILYGSGYVLFAFLDTELVKTGILSRQELIDAIAVGQFTPGPVFSAATFIGWQIGGLAGAVAATIGIFLPSFLFVALLNPLIPKLRTSAIMSSFLDTVNAASVSIILVVCVEMGKDSIQDWRGIVIAIAGFIITVLYKKINTAFIVLGGAILGYLLTMI